MTSKQNCKTCVFETVSERKGSQLFSSDHKVLIGRGRIKKCSTAFTKTNEKNTVLHVKLSL